MDNITAANTGPRVPRHSTWYSRPTPAANDAAAYIPNAHAIAADSAAWPDSEMMGDCPECGAPNITTADLDDTVEAIAQAAYMRGHDAGLREGEAAAGSEHWWWGLMSGAVMGGWLVGAAMSAVYAMAHWGG
jgi:hypothetical protein